MCVPEGLSGGVAADERLQRLRQIVRSWHAGAVDQDRDHTDVATERSRNFDGYEIMQERGEMSRMLKIYQYKKHPLIQITDGRHPYAAEENTKGWVERGSIEASPDAIADFLTVAPSTVLEEIERKGWCQLDHFQIQEVWRSRWVER